MQEVLSWIRVTMATGKVPIPLAGQCQFNLSKPLLHLTLRHKMSRLNTGKSICNHDRNQKVYKQSNNKWNRKEKFLGGKSITPHQGNPFLIPFHPATPQSQSETLERLFERDTVQGFFWGAYPVDDPFPKKLFGTIGFQLGDGIRCLESEAQNTELSLEVAKIQFSLSGL